MTFAEDELPAAELSCTFTNKYSPSFSVLMILCTECCETSAQISVGHSKLKDKCSKTLMCILSSMPSRADKSIKWQRKATSIMFDRFTGWGLTCHRAVIYSLALLHRKGWRETSLTLNSFALRDTDEMRKMQNFWKFHQQLDVWGTAVRILLAGLLCVVQLWCDKTLNKTGLFIYVFVCFEMSSSCSQSLSL